jgi:hypothetical protein
VFTRHYYDEQNKEDEMGGTCSTLEDEKFYAVSLGKPEKKRPVRKRRRRWRIMIRKQDVRMWLARNQVAGSHEWGQISRLAERLSASEGLYAKWS